MAASDIVPTAKKLLASEGASTDASQLCAQMSDVRAHVFTAGKQTSRVIELEVVVAPGADDPHRGSQVLWLAPGKAPRQRTFGQVE
jgi:hypothetical protein